MTIRPICITGEPVLHQRATGVTVFDDELRTLVADMYETMDKAPGVGLAAPQIGEDWQVVFFGSDEPNPRYPEAPTVTARDHSHEAMAETARAILRSRSGSSSMRPR